MFHRLKSWMQSGFNRSTSAEHESQEEQQAPEAPEGHKAPTPLTSEQEAEELARAVAERLKRIYSEGSGTAEDPYPIRNEDQFHAIGLAPEAHFLVMRDILLTRPVEPIAEFKGAIDGRGLEIDGLRAPSAWIDINEGTVRGLRFLDLVIHGRPDDHAVGLVSMNRGTLVSLKIWQGRISSASPEQGSLLASMAAINEGHVSACTFSGELHSDAAGIGGIVGGNSPEGRVQDCRTFGSLADLVTERGVSMGGIAAVNIGVVRDCLAEATLTMNTVGPADIGGVVSLQPYAGVTIGCLSDSSIVVENSRRKAIGGVCGYNRGMLIDCIHRGKLPQTRRGVVGLMAGAQSPSGGIRHGEVSESTIRALKRKVRDSEQLSRILIGRQVSSENPQAPYLEPEEVEFDSDPENMIRLFH